ncbi:DUF92 domain-containing protein [Lewinella sp. JB7]|uniref:DUF92 domain-containing protein n=1 Tax=Lewinella sp. JB7 TaxID=2962887 RepID=UPI0020CA1F69|nr:DUF92 domain-containing protein [Lewinella sp. JB7]MCP9236103.1 DUF92 domain-containing protein [Lewinella sp. JB7]
MVNWLLFGVGAVAFGLTTWRRGSLTAGGAVTAVVIGTVVTAMAGVPWLLPLFVFFLSSSVLGRMLPAGTDAGDHKDKQPRDAVQVLCNGGVYAVLAGVGADPELLLVSLAVATSDTWASEIGKYVRQPTYDVLRLRRVPPGLSGGVSLAGTVGGAAGAAVIGMLAFLVGPADISGTVVYVAIWGFIGMLVDSLLGSALQARYADVDGVLSDVARPGGRLVGGLHWMTNDLVNLIAIAVTVALATAIG